MFLNNNVLPEGTLMANTVFIGGVDSWMDETQLKEAFSKFGSVKECKIITDRTGVCRGYGFVSFSGDVDVQNIVESQISILGRKLRLAPAIRKQTAHPRSDATGPTHPHHASMFTHYVQSFPYIHSTPVMFPQTPLGYQQPGYYHQVPPQWPNGDQNIYAYPQSFWCYGNEMESNNDFYTTEYQVPNMCHTSVSSQKKVDKSIQTSISCLCDGEGTRGKSFCSQDHMKDKRRFTFRKTRA